MKKVLITILIGLWLTIGASIFVALIFPQLVIAPYINYKFSKDKVPNAYITPIQRTVTASEADVKGHQEFTSYGLMFGVPWKEKPEKIERGSAIFFKFPDKKFVVLFDPESIPPPREILLKGNPNDVEKVKAFFGEGILDSNYDFYSHILNTSPDQITIFTPKKEAMSKAILVVLKTVLVITPSGGNIIYSFVTDNNIKGFQWGRDEVRGRTLVTLFDQNDVQYEMVIGGTQEEIDFILSSIEIRR